MLLFIFNLEILAAFKSLYISFRDANKWNGASSFIISTLFLTAISIGYYLNLARLSVQDSGIKSCIVHPIIGKELLHSSGIV
jgi:uncharacterized membrane protein YbhN (UPF0104 family)